MSKFERISLFFGFVGLLADFAALFTFATGLLSFSQVIPSSVPLPAASTAFSVGSGLLIAYGWLVVSWYLTRRSIVLRNERPTTFHNPLSARSARAVVGIGIFIVPLVIAWIIVTGSLPSSGSPISPSTVVLTPVITQTPTQTITILTTATVTNTQQIPTPRPMTEDEKRASNTMLGLIFGLPFGLILLGGVIYASINLLMPLVHIEMLGDE